MATDLEPKTLVRGFGEQIIAHSEARKGSLTTVQRIFVEDIRSQKEREREEAAARKRFEDFQLCTDNAGQNKAVHARQAKDLDIAWGQFCEKIPSDERASFDLRATSFEDVSELMKRVADKWEKNRNQGKAGAICKFYRRCCMSIKSHESMLKLLPEGDKYFSLFTGVLKSVVYATANHEKIAIGLSKAIAEISETVKSCSSRRELYNTLEIQELTMKLYAHIFKFFQNVLKWYVDKVWKRLLKSFNEDLYDIFEDQITSIRDVAESIKDTSWLGQAGELRATRLRLEMLEQTCLDMANRQIRIAEDQLKREEIAEARQAHLALQIGRTLEDHASRLLMAPPRPRQLLKSSSAEGLRQMAGNLLEVHEVKRDDILLDSRHLEDFFDRARVRIAFDPSAVSVPNDAVGRLQSWAAGKGSPLLCITGPESTHSLGPSAMSFLAAKIVNLVDDSKLPVISYFCEKRRRSNPKGLSAHAQGTVALIHALLRQSLELLTPKLETSEDMAAVTKLSSDLECFEQALLLLDAALQNGKSIVYCVIDGIQDIEDRFTLKYLEMLIKLLKKRAAGVGEQRVKLRVLLTTSGRSRCLIRNLGRFEMVLADDLGNNLQSIRDSQPLILSRVISNQ